jgi:predicted RNA-binding Zn-ribbon protein involved in translation (DUF1610 family)
VRVEHHCPQCGGPVTLEETDRLFQCGFCRVRLYIISKDILRYALIPPTPVDEKLLYVPYWRLKGMYYALKPFQVRHKTIDMNLRATSHAFLPETMGIRTQTLRLRFASPKERATFLEPRVPIEDLLPGVDASTHFSDTVSAPGKTFHRAFVGDMVSTIYAPIYVKGRAIYDGILRRPLGRLTPVRVDALEAGRGKRRDWSVRFVSAICPHCGWDLEGGRKSVALLCKNCHRGWHVGRAGRFRKLHFAVSGPPERGAVYLPFWRMRARVEGLSLDTYADLVRFANLPRALRGEWEGQGVSFWAPAFKTAPRLFLRLAKQMTVLQPDGSAYRDEFPKNTLHPVNLSAEHAASGIIATVAGLAKPKKRLFPKLSSARASLTEAVLVYLPFVSGPRDYVQSRFGFAIQKNALRS